MSALSGGDVAWSMAVVATVPSPSGRLSGGGLPRRALTGDGARAL